ncbi:hypothetical protein [Campylobacter jejuni]|uniref:hypothetical protein n=1 Tax=Campylobacter jejuni TaxID=197 RepID=UPI001930EBF5|nr:hypothetical protein [Campylobacter jejuni]
MENKIKGLVELCEQALAPDGDYDFGNLKYLEGPRYTSIEYTYNTSPFVYKVIYDNLEYYFYRRESYHILATKVPEEYPTKDDPNGTKDRFYPIAMIRLLPTDKLKRMGYSNVYTVCAVEVDKALRGKKLGKLLYYLATAVLGYTLLGDSEQYENARRMYYSFSNNPGFTVDIIKLGQGVLERDVNLYNHNDERVWSKTPDKVGRLHRVVLKSVTMESKVKVEKLK